MKTLSVLINAVYFFLSYATYSQISSGFTLNVTDKSGRLKNIYIGESYYLSEYKAAKFLNDSASVNDSQFNFAGELLYPTAVRLFTLNRQINFNRLIFIQPGNQEYTITYDSTNNNFKILANAEYYINDEYNFFMQKVGISSINEPILLEKFESYVKTNQSSYVALYALIDQDFNYGFSNKLYRVANNFDSLIINTKGYEYFAKERLWRNVKVPLVSVFDKNLKIQKLNLRSKDRKATLVEFWFSGCKGCIPNLITLKKEFYKLNKRFNIITICTDERRLYAKSKKIIENIKPLYINFWDFGGKVFSTITKLYKYPGNLLIDSNGFIIGKDVNLTKIQEFIK